MVFGKGHCGFKTKIRFRVSAKMTYKFKSGNTAFVTSHLTRQGEQSFADNIRLHTNENGIRQGTAECRSHVLEIPIVENYPGIYYYTLQLWLGAISKDNHESVKCITIECQMDWTDPPLERKIDEWWTGLPENLGAMDHGVQFQTRNTNPQMCPKRRTMFNE